MPAETVSPRIDRVSGDRIEPGGSDSLSTQVAEGLYSLLAPQCSLQAIEEGDTPL